MIKDESLLKAIFKAIKKTYSDWKEHKQAVKSKKDLLSSKSDFRLLEEFIQQVNKDPYLQVNVTLNDGTKIKIMSWADRNEKIKNSVIDSTVYDQDGDVIFIK